MFLSGSPGRGMIEPSPTTVHHSKTPVHPVVQPRGAVRRGPSTVRRRRAVWPRVQQSAPLPPVEQQLRGPDSPRPPAARLSSRCGPAGTGSSPGRSSAVHLLSGATPAPPPRSPAPASRPPAPAARTRSATAPARTPGRSVESRSRLPAFRPHWSIRSRPQRALSCSSHYPHPGLAHIAQRRLRRQGRPDPRHDYPMLNDVCIPCGGTCQIAAFRCVGSFAVRGVQEWTGSRPPATPGLRRCGACHVGAGTRSPSGAWHCRAGLYKSERRAKSAKNCAQHLTGLAPLVTARYRTFRPLRPCEHPATPFRPVSTPPAPA